jgi:hypothetical protein
MSALDLAALFVSVLPTAVLAESGHLGEPLPAVDAGVRLLLGVGKEVPVLWSETHNLTFSRRMVIFHLNTNQVGYVCKRLETCSAGVFVFFFLFVALFDVNL